MPFSMYSIQVITRGGLRLVMHPFIETKAGLMGCRVLAVRAGVRRFLLQCRSSEDTVRMSGIWPISQCKNLP